MTFTHLSVHSKASMLYGSADIKKLVGRAKELGQPAVALTDYSNVFEAINFYRAANEAGIKPILGVDLYFCEDAKQLRIQKVRQVSHIILLAENDIGWRNIARLVSKANSEDYYFYNPRVDFNLLEQYSEGVICLTGGSLDGAIASHLYDRVDDAGEVSQPAALFKAEGLVRRFLKIFDSDHFFLEVQDTDTPEQEQINTRLRGIAVKYGLRTVASNNVHYVEQHDAESHKTLLDMNANKYSRATYTNFSAEEYYLKSREEMESLSFTPDELDATLEIADRCQVNIDLKKRRLPKYEFIPDGKTSEAYLRELALEGLQKIKRVETSGESYEDRLERELADIEEMGFADYFLIVHDVISWVRRNGILVGRGRGSAGGSLVSYTLGITEIDPLEYGLIWERFLNKGRGGLPDIDTDVPRSQRQKVLEYVKERFGAGNVAQLVTLGGLQAKAILKEVFKVYGMPFDEANKITGLVPAKNDDHVAISLQEAIDAVPELKEYYDQYTPWFKVALALEGCYKTTGIHAAAVVISDVPFEDSSYPLARSKDGSPIFGWDMNTVDSLSLLKLDILGLTTLDDIQVTMDLVKERRGIELSRETMPLNDPVTWAMIGQGFTIGIFQIEKQLGRTWSKNLQPESIEELSDLVSLIRPGPMECLAGDTPILTWIGNGKKKSYRYKTIEELHADYTKLRLKQYGRNAGGPPQLGICSVDESNHSIVSNNALKIVKTGTKDVYNLTLAVDYNGYRPQRKGLYIKASLGHRFLTIRSGELGPRWRELREIEPNDYVCILKKQYTKKKNNQHAQGWRHFKDIATQHYQKRCVFCKWHEASLDVHHIEGNRYTNNEHNNLCFVCPNHHRMISEDVLDQEDILTERWKWELPNTEDLMYCRVHSIDKIGRQPTYDIAMNGPHHNYIAGDFVVHNSNMHTAYRGVKNKGEDPTYIHPSLESIMGPTYSALLYQEQVIYICQQLAGMNSVDADMVRKAMGKKKPEEMAKWKEAFVNGCIANDIDPMTADEIWGYIEKFAGYGFNKCGSGKLRVIRAGANQYKGREISLEELWRYFHGDLKRTSTGKKYRNQTHPNLGLRIMAMKDGRIKPDRVADVIQTGVKTTYRLRLDTGHEGRWTEDHKFWTSNGWKCLKEMKVGDTVYIGGQYEPATIMQSRKLSRFSDVSITERSYKKNTQWGLPGEDNASYIDGSYIAFQSERQRRIDEISHCEQCNQTAGRYELAHLDGDHTNQSDDNLRLMCVSCHKKYDYEHNDRTRRFEKGYPIDAGTIVSIDGPQEEMTYDIEMCGDEHNYIANGIITHNSHGVGYALLAYETAYLKANYTIEFLTAKLRHAESHPNKFEQMSALSYDAKLFDIEVVPPRVSMGNKDFAVVDDTHIAFGLTALKGVGATAVNDIVKIGKDCDTFDDVLWKWKTTKNKVNTGVMTALIRGGAFDDLEEHRVESQGRFRLMEAVVPREIELITHLAQYQDGDFDWVKIVTALADDDKALLIKKKYDVKIPDVRRREKLRLALQEYHSREIFDTKAQRIAWEQHYLGIALSGSEADIYKAQHTCIDIIKTGHADMSFEIAVCIDGVREHIVSKGKSAGQPMAFVTARDKTFVMDNIVVFPRTFAQSKRLLEEGNVLRIRGKVDDRGSLIADRVERLQ